MRVYYLVIPLAVLAVALMGGWLTNQGVSTWYMTLALPEVAPAGGVIGTVWTVIFILSAVAVVLIWNERKKIRQFNWVVGLLTANAVLNVAWSYLFFVQHLIGWAIVEMIVLNLTTLAIIVLVRRKQQLAAWLLVPYFLWVCFATYLAYSIWLLN